MYNSLTGDFTEISQTVDEITRLDICLFCYGWYNSYDFLTYDGKGLSLFQQIRVLW